MSAPFDADLLVIEQLDKTMGDILIQGVKSFRLAVQLPSGSTYLRTYKDWILVDNRIDSQEDWK